MLLLRQAETMADGCRESSAQSWTSCKRENTLFVISSHLAQHVPLLSAPICKHYISITIQNALRLILADLEQLYVEMDMCNFVLSLIIQAMLVC